MLPLLVIDAFDDGPFTGNPAAVVLLEAPAPESWMQSVAAEMNLSETAFVRPVDDGFELRWFTPACEVELCGHATLASGAALWATGRLGGDEAARFRTRWAGPLRAVPCADGRVTIDLPRINVEESPLPDAMIAALGVRPVVTGFARGTGKGNQLVAVATADEVRGATPDFEALRIFERAGFMLTAPGDDGGDADFVSRYFAPWYGVDEDPVTGSAHAALGPWWSRRLDRTTLVARQLSRRGGRVEVQVDDDRVRLTGRTRVVVRGSIVV